MRICSGDFSFYEDVFMEICHLKICSGDFSLFHEDVFMEICPLKICSGDFPFEDLFRRFFPFEDLFMEICSIFMKMCSWRFVL